MQEQQVCVTDDTWYNWLDVVDCVYIYNVRPQTTGKKTGVILLELKEVVLQNSPLHLEDLLPRNLTPFYRYAV